MERWRIQQAEAALAAREAAIAIERASGIVDANADAVDAETEAMRRQIGLRRQLAEASAAQAVLDRQRAAGDSLAGSLANDFERALTSAEGLKDLLPSIARDIQSFAIRETVTAPLETFLKGSIRNLVDGGGAVSTGAAATAAATQVAQQTAATAAITAQTSATVARTAAEVTATTSVAAMTAAATAAAAALATVAASGATDAAGNLVGSIIGLFGDNPFAAIALADGTNYVPYDGMPATLHKGEAVVPAKYNPAAGGAPAGVRPVMNVYVENNAAGAQVRTEQDSAGDLRVIVDTAKAAVIDDVQRGGRVHEALKSTYGLRRNLARRY